jgi:choline-glycine betaine transporter
VGTFIARISKGRTIREFVLGVMLVPTAVSALWFVVFGGAGIKLQLGGLNIAGAGDAAAGFFAMLQHYPFFVGTAIVVMFLTAIFFVSGADAGALVLATLSSRGRTEPWDPLVTLWAVLTGVVAIMLLLVGGLSALQTFTIIAASPFVLVLIGLCVSLYADLRRDPARARRAGPMRVQWAGSPPSYSRFHEEAVSGDNGNGQRPERTDGEVVAGARANGGGALNRS